MLKVIALRRDMQLMPRDMKQRLQITLPMLKVGERKLLVDIRTLRVDTMRNQVQKFIILLLLNLLTLRVKELMLQVERLMPKA